MATRDCSADLSTLLAGASLGLTVGTNLFQGLLPEADAADSGGTTIPDKAVSVLMTGGAPPQGFIGQGAKAQRLVTCQVRVRSDREDFEGGQTLALQVSDVIHLATVSGFIFVRVRESAPVYFGPDGADRHQWALNVEMLYLDAP